MRIWIKRRISPLLMLWTAPPFATLKMRMGTASRHTAHSTSEFDREATSNHLNVWSVLSSPADGHAAFGNFAFGPQAAVAAMPLRCERGRADRVVISAK